MDTLKLIIFDVLTEKITVSKLENWLYNSEEIMNEIDLNSFYFDVISINYKSCSWKLELNHLAECHLHNDYLEILTIKRSCLNIIESETFEDTHKMLTAAVRDFEYNTGYSILWVFSRFKDYFDLVKEGIWKKGTLKNEVKFHSKKTIEIIKNFKNIDELKSQLEENLKPFKD
ncbi:hypothetical protein [Lacinutrix jangbogonensis]|uniref:hypothetical protein n=1 Tax=Lacinutrix jangbogonensis TaxID=1469557 RepID=UPI00053D6150|nr:hypothetical protein [Lacinutrix jangbogonensis]